MASVDDVMTRIRATWGACPSCPSKALGWLLDRQIAMESRGGYDQHEHTEMFQAWRALSRAMRGTTTYVKEAR